MILVGLPGATCSLLGCRGGKVSAVDDATAPIGRPPSHTYHIAHACTLCIRYWACKEGTIYMRMIGRGWKHAMPRARGLGEQYAVTSTCGQCICVICLSPSLGCWPDHYHNASKAGSCCRFASMPGVLTASTGSSPRETHACNPHQPSLGKVGLSFGCWPARPVATAFRYTGTNRLG